MDSTCHVPRKLTGQPQDTKSADRAEIMRGITIHSRPQRLRVLQNVEAGILLDKQISYRTVGFPETTVEDDVGEVLRQARRLQPHAGRDQGLELQTMRIFFTRGALNLTPVSPLHPRAV